MFDFVKPITYADTFNGMPIQGDCEVGLREDVLARFHLVTSAAVARCPVVTALCMEAHFPDVGAFPDNNVIFVSFLASFIGNLRTRFPPLLYMWVRERYPRNAKNHFYQLILMLPGNCCAEVDTIMDEAVRCWSLKLAFSDARPLVRLNSTLQVDGLRPGLMVIERNEPAFQEQLNTFFLWLSGLARDDINGNTPCWGHQFGASRIDSPVHLLDP